MNGAIIAVIVIVVAAVIGIVVFFILRSKSGSTPPPPPPPPVGYGWLCDPTSKQCAMSYDPAHPGPFATCTDCLMSGCASIITGCSCINGACTPTCDPTPEYSTCGECVDAGECSSLTGYSCVNGTCLPTTASSPQFPNLETCAKSGSCFVQSCQCVNGVIESVTPTGGNPPAGISCSNLLECAPGGECNQRILPYACSADGFNCVQSPAANSQFMCEALCQRALKNIGTTACSAVPCPTGFVKGSDFNCYRQSPGGVPLDDCGSLHCTATGDCPNSGWEGHCAGNCGLENCNCFCVDVTSTPQNMYQCIPSSGGGCPPSSPASGTPNACWVQCNNATGCPADGTQWLSSTQQSYCALP